MSARKRSGSGNGPGNKVEDKGPFLPTSKRKRRTAALDFPVPGEVSAEKLDRVVVVLVGTKYPGNIGQTARVLRNFGYRRLVVVNPRCRIDVEAEKMAVDCEDMLDRIPIYDSLKEAVREARIVVGATRRRGTKRRNVLDPHDCAQLLEPVPEVGDAALVFGAEDRGLSNDELACCQWIASIPSASDHPSFNLSHAVAIFLYEITCALLDPQPRNWAKHKSYEDMFDHLQEYLSDIGFLKEKDPRRMMVAIRRMLYRGRFTEREVRIIRGIITQSRWRMANPDAEPDKAPEPEGIEDSEEEPEEG